MRLTVVPRRTLTAIEVAPIGNPVLNNVMAWRPDRSGFADSGWPTRAAVSLAYPSLGSAVVLPRRRSNENFDALLPSLLDDLAASANRRLQSPRNRQSVQQVRDDDVDTFGMEIYEFDGDDAEADLLRHLVTSEVHRLRVGGAVLISGSEPVLAERLAVALATATGGALVSHLPVARHTLYQHAITSGTPVILLTEVTPGRALAFALAGGMVDFGWPEGARAVQALLAVGPRYTHLAWDNDLECLRATTGVLTELLPALD
ncbi:hypothetical protein O2W15_20020 [Modestobacter sp. VKM Ac-2979]|uniref:hypothetical protein n=1 Tax=unclassified Modestobacter TaxID=2643866 RepID=UPI0022AB606E|nr:MULTISPECIES: hypothetical protein [unclassified Modestobacter]MCZ2813723.1 hypothetical protein [Modestobacter sp. VKM Ac-2979]MCZ2844302.1 hypothetical protein [Modestobacter sp. VKM Ac-2980]